jgi:hypothetical protein
VLSHYEGLSIGRLIVKNETPKRQGARLWGGTQIVSYMSWSREEAADARHAVSSPWTEKG